MVKKTLIASLIMAGIFTSSIATSAGKTHWAYSGQEGPAHWGELEATFSICSTGKNQ